MPPEKAKAAIIQLRDMPIEEGTERDADAKRKREKRSESARIEIPWHTINHDRRIAALADPV